MDPKTYVVRFSDGETKTFQATRIITSSMSISGVSNSKVRVYGPEGIIAIFDEYSVSGWWIEE